MVGVGDFFSGRSGQTVAKVNGKKVSWYEVNHRYENLVSQIQYAQNRDLQPHELAAIKNYAKQMVVEQQAMLDATEKRGYQISDSMVINALQTNPVFQEDGRFSKMRYHQALMSSHPPMSDVAYREHLKEQLLLQQPQDGVSRSSFLLPSELSRLISMQEQTRDFQYAIVPVSRFLKEQVPTTDAIEAYYQKHFNTFIEPERVSVQYLELSIPELMKHLAVSEADLQRYYEQHQEQYETPELLRGQHILIASTSDKSIEDAALKVKAEQLLSELNQGADFGVLAKEHSSDESSAHQSGDLGWFGRGELPDQALEDALFGLAVNRVAGPIKTKFGYHLVKLTERQEAKLKPLPKVKDEIKSRYLHEQAEYLLTEKAEELSNLTFEQPDTLEVAASNLGLSIQTTELFTREEGQGIADSKDIRDAAFNEDVLLGNNNSELIKLNEESYLVLRIHEHVPSKQKPLSDVTDEISEKLKLEMAKEKTLAHANELKAELSKLDLKTLSQNHQLKFNDKVGVMRFEQSVPAEIINQVFRMNKPQEDKEVGQIALSGGDVALISLSKVQDGDIQETDPTLQEAYSSNYAHARAKLEFSLYSDELVRNSNISWLD